MASRLNGHELGQALGDGEGQGSLVCCSPVGCKELDMTQWLNNDNEKQWPTENHALTCGHLPLAHAILNILKMSSPQPAMWFCRNYSSPRSLFLSKTRSWTDVTFRLPSNSDFLLILNLVVSHPVLSLWWMLDACLCGPPGLSQRVLHTDTGMVHFLNTLNPLYLLHLLLSSECLGLPPQLSCKKSSDLFFSVKHLGMMGGAAPLISSVVAGWHSSSH